MALSDFIEVYENAFSDEICDAVIKQFETSIKTGASVREYSPQIYREDSVLYLNEPNMPLTAEFNQQLVRITDSYVNKYSTLKSLNTKSFLVLVQKTKPSEGYHLWHCEQASIDTSSRIIVWTVYLNDVDEGGETEFLYQQRRIKPSKGSLCLFPASWTHTHRGNPPISNTKYIATGWFYLY
jgi:hypothetical protein